MQGCQLGTVSPLMPSLETVWLKAILNYMALSGGFDVLRFDAQGGSVLILFFRVQIELLNQYFMSRKQ